MIIILDTVVIVRALINPRSRCGRLVYDHALNLEIVASAAIIGEYLQVIQRPGLQRKYRPIATRGLRTILDLLDNARIVEPAVVLAVCRDPDDDKFLAAAVEGNVEYLVTEDADLLVLGRYEHVTILTATELLRILEAS